MIERIRLGSTPIKFLEDHAKLGAGNSVAVL